MPPMIKFGDFEFIFGIKAHKLPITKYEAIFDMYPYL